MREMWFSYSEEGFELHTCAAAAKQAAENAFSAEFASAVLDGEWSEYVEYIAWGRVHGTATVVETSPEGVMYGLTEVSDG